MSELVNLNKESFEKVTSTNDKALIIDFWAPWCGPCKALTPILEELASEMGDLVGVYKVNVDDNAELAQEHGVQSIPTPKEGNLCSGDAPAIPSKCKGCNYDGDALRRHLGQKKSCQQHLPVNFSN